MWLLSYCCGCVFTVGTALTTVAVSSVHSVSESHWQTRVMELEERVLQQSQDLDSHVHMIALLEAEKLDNMKGECVFP
jgi:hypothetical protein